MLLIKAITTRCECTHGPGTGLHRTELSDKVMTSSPMNCALLLSHKAVTITYIHSAPVINAHGGKNCSNNQMICNDLSGLPR